MPPSTGKSQAAFDWQALGVAMAASYGSGKGKKSQAYWDWGQAASSSAGEWDPKGSYMPSMHDRDAHAKSQAAKADFFGKRYDDGHAKGPLPCGKPMPAHIREMFGKHGDLHGYWPSGKASEKGPGKPAKFGKYDHPVWDEGRPQYWSDGKPPGFKFAMGDLPFDADEAWVLPSALPKHDMRVLCHAFTFLFGKRMVMKW